MAPLTAYTVPVAPWTFPKHPDRGVAPEYLHFLFDAVGVPLRLDSLPYLRVLESLRNGTNAAALLIPDVDRDRYAYRLCQVTTIRSGLVYKRRRFPVMDMAHLIGRTVGIPLGTHALDTLSHVPRLTMYPVESIAQGLTMLRADHLDATFLSIPGSKSVLTAAGMDGNEYGWQEFASAPVVVYVSRRSPLLGDNGAIERLKAACAGKAKAEMDLLMRKYQ